jgi:acylphosphatase
MSEATKSPIAKISLDTTMEDVVRFDSEGLKLFFESTPGRFKELTEEDVRKLSARGKESYLQALMSYNREKAAKPTAGIQMQPERAMAQSRMAIDATPEFFAKYHPCWKRPDELQRAQLEGYSFATAQDGVKGFSSNSENGSITIGVAGNTELVLMKIPRETYEMRQRVITDKSKAAAKTAEAVGAAEIDKVGKSFQPSPRDERQWKELGVSNGKQG